eukprot:1191795-Prorocentrum_minimum.AAC.3
MRGISTNVQTRSTTAPSPRIRPLGAPSSVSFPAESSPAEASPAESSPDWSDRSRFLGCMPPPSPAAPTSADMTPHAPSPPSAPLRSPPPSADSTPRAPSPLPTPASSLPPSPAASVTRPVATSRTCSRMCRPIVRSNGPDSARAAVWQLLPDPPLLWAAPGAA